MYCSLTEIPDIYILYSALNGTVILVVKHCIFLLSILSLQKLGNKMGSDANAVHITFLNQGELLMFYFLCFVKYNSSIEKHNFLLKKNPDLYFWAFFFVCFLKYLYQNAHLFILNGNCFTILEIHNYTSYGFLKCDKKRTFLIHNNIWCYNLMYILLKYLVWYFRIDNIHLKKNGKEIWTNILIVLSPRTPFSFFFLTNSFLHPFFSHKDLWM